MQYEMLLVDIDQGAAVITLNRPKALNSINEQLVVELGMASDELAKNEEVRAIILTGGGGKAFAAGGDVAYMAPLDAMQARRFIMLLRDTLFRFENLPLPTIAAVNGMALGGGCELAMCCDLRIAEEQAIFGQPEISLGIIPGAGGTQRLPRLVGAGRAKEMVYLGGNISAAEAHRIGLVNKVVPTGTALEEAKKIAQKLAAKGAVALQMAKAAINVGNQLDLNSGLTYEAECFSALFSTEDQKEGMKAFMEKRPAQFRGR
jgi:enoyl-CoA hydratase